MALKDWKQTIKEKEYLRFYNSKNELHLFIESLQKDTIIGKELFKKGWYARVMNNSFNEKNIYLNSDVIKTKSKALKIAKDYMRSH